MDPRGLCMRVRPWACECDTCALLAHLTLRGDVFHRATPYLSKGLGAASYDRFTEGSKAHSFPECVDDHRLLCGANLHHLRSEAIDVFLEGLTLILLYIEQVVRDRRWSTIY